MGLLYYWAGICILTFLAFGLDKWKAVRKRKNPKIRRIPEKVLFLLAGLGGSAGALLGMQLWHHKTLHRSFRYGIPLILLAQAVLCAGIWWFRRHGF